MMLMQAQGKQENQNRLETKNQIIRKPIVLKKVDPCEGYEEQKDDEEEPEDIIEMMRRIMGTY